MTYASRGLKKQGLAKVRRIVDDIIGSKGRATFQTWNQSPGRWRKVIDNDGE